MAKSNVIIKQKKSETEVVDIYPQTESNIVINNSTNVTGGTVTDAFDSALPLTAGKNISINPKDTGVEISFTGSLAPNVTVQGESNNPVEVSGTPTATNATYTVTHKTNGFTKNYDSGNTTTSISGSGASGKIKIPQITVDTYGHVTAAADQEVTITMPSTDNMVTADYDIATNRIVVGSNNGKGVRGTNYIINNANLNIDSAVPTSSAIKAYVDNAITNGAQYLGTVSDATTHGPHTLYPNAGIGDWCRSTGRFNYYDVSTTSTTEVHIGDILINTSDTVSNQTWDVIHTEVDTDTWRPVQVNGASIDSSNTHNTLNLKAGTNVGLSNSNGTVTINATDTTYTITQDVSAQNQFTFKPTGQTTGTTITINNVANATTATKVANTLTINWGSNSTVYNGSGKKTIDITASNIGAAASDHTHGNINNAGIVTGGISNLNNAKLVVTDADSKIAGSSITFDGTTTNTALTPSGQWKSFLQNNQSITINSGLKHKKLDSDPDVFITGTANGRTPTLGESGIGKGIYSAIEVNKQGIAIAGSQVIKYYAWGTTDKFIKEDTNLASGGFAFVELP